MSTKLTFLVSRPWGDEMTQALVRAEVSGGIVIGNDAEFLKRLRSAVTAWVKETEVGRREWKQSAEDFNVGDLAGCCGDPELELRLRRYGITGLNIETNVQVGCRNWEFDTVLVDEEKLEEDQ